MNVKEVGWDCVRGQEKGWTERERQSKRDKEAERESEGVEERTPAAPFYFF